MSGVFKLNRIVLPIFIFAAFLFSGVHARAQGYTPPGSYKDTCRGIQVVGSNLIAQCKKVDGSWRNSTLMYHECEGDIRNDNGELKCKQKVKPVKPVPGGSYQKSCKDYYVEGKRLYAKCEKKNGGWNKSSVNYKNCNKDIWNDNGVLTCGNKNGAKLPKGSYKQSCKNYYIEGNLLEAECKNKNGKWVHTSIKYKNCNKGVWNDKGKLRCN